MFHCCCIRSGATIIHLLCGTLPVPFVPVRVTSGPGIHVHLLAAGPYSTVVFVYMTQYLFDDLGDTVIDGMWLAGFKRRVNANLLIWLANLLIWLALSSFVFIVFFFVSLLLRVGFRGEGLPTDRVAHSAQTLLCRLYKIIIILIIIIITIICSGISKLVTAAEFIIMRRYTTVCCSYNNDCVGAIFTMLIKLRKWRSN